jgi:hypothetical protein
VATRGGRGGEGRHENGSRTKSSGHRNGRRRRKRKRKRTRSERAEQQERNCATTREPKAHIVATVSDAEWRAEEGGRDDGAAKRKGSKRQSNRGK